LKMVSGPLGVKCSVIGDPTSMVIGTSAWI
jgi:hypothetical protein